MRRDEIAGARDLSGMSDVLPGAMEDALLLGLEDAIVDVPAGGESIAALNALAMEVSATKFEVMRFSWNWYERNRFKCRLAQLI